MITENIVAGSFFIIYGKWILLILAGIGVMGFLILVVLLCVAVITAGIYMEEDIKI